MVRMPYAYSADHPAAVSRPGVSERTIALQRVVRPSQVLRPPRSRTFVQSSQERTRFVTNPHSPLRFLGRQQRRPFPKTRSIPQAPQRSAAPHSRCSPTPSIPSPVDQPCTLDGPCHIPVRARPFPNWRIHLERTDDALCGCVRRSVALSLVTACESCPCPWGCRSVPGARHLRAGLCTRESGTGCLVPAVDRGGP